MLDGYDVAVVGAGAAGVAAARHVWKSGRSVILIEASERVGGRAWTYQIEGVPLDMGCGWLHSADRNPLSALAVEAGFAIDRTPSAWRVQYRDLGYSPEDQAASRNAWEDFQARLQSDPPASDCALDALDRAARWAPYFEAISSYMNGAGLARLSVADFLAYDEASTMENWRVPAGYGALVGALMPPVPVRLAMPVSHVDSGGPEVRLATPGGTIKARAAIVTVSTAVLASGAIRFTPAAAVAGHLDAAACLPLGLANKVFLGLGDGHGLEPDSHLLGNPLTSRTASYYLMPFGRPVIEAFVGGDFAEELERAGLAATFAFLADELAALLGNGIRGKLRLLAGSAWRGMDGFGGSYSHALPGHASARAILAEAIDDRLFFAGEATHPFDFSTAHGAWESGERAAAEALEALS